LFDDLVEEMKEELRLFPANTLRRTQQHPCLCADSAANSTYYIKMPVNLCKYTNIQLSFFVLSISASPKQYLSNEGKSYKQDEVLK